MSKLILEFGSRIVRKILSASEKSCLSAQLTASSHKRRVSKKDIVAGWNVHWTVGQIKEALLICSSKMRKCDEVTVGTFTCTPSWISSCQLYGFCPTQNKLQSIIYGLLMGVQSSAPFWSYKLFFPIFHHDVMQQEFPYYTQIWKIQAITMFILSFIAWARKMFVINVSKTR